MNQLIEWKQLIEQQNASLAYRAQLLESVADAALTEALCDLQTCMECHVLPAFKTLSEQMDKQHLYEVGDDDAVLQKLLDKHNGNVQQALAALDQHATQQPLQPSSGVIQAARAAIARLGRSFQNLPKVKNTDQWMKSKTEQINAWIDENYKGPAPIALLKSTLKKLRDWTKSNPKKSAFAIGLIGALLGATTGYVVVKVAIGLMTILLKIGLAVLNGQKFSSAVAKTLTVAGLGLLTGYGLSHAFKSIYAAADALPTATPGSAAAIPPAPSISPPAADAMIQQVAKDPWIEKLSSLVDPTGEGTGIPNIDAPNFGQAFAKARQAMGPGHVFTWAGKAFTTNTTPEGLLSGLSNAAKKYIQGKS